MKTLFKSLILAILILVPFTVSAQKVIVQDLESWMSSLITQAIDNKVVVDKNLGQERDIQKEGNPLKWRCDILTFTLSKKQRSVLEDMIRAFEENGHHNPNCYGINSKRMNTSQAEGKRSLMIGDNPNNYVTIGENYGNYLNVNILDPTDTTKTHRYAYALEWKEDRKGNAFVRYIVTYAKIPSAFTNYKATIKYPSTTIDLGRSRIYKDVPKQAENKARAWYLQKDKVAKSIDKDIKDLNSKAIADYQNFIDSMRFENRPSLESLDKDFVRREDTNYGVKGSDGVWLPNNDGDAVNDMLCNDNVLLMFSNLKQYYNSHQNAEFTAISIYTLCKQANTWMFFMGAKEELEQLISEVTHLRDTANSRTDRMYFKMALDQLNQLKKKLNF